MPDNVMTTRIDGYSAGMSSLPIGRGAASGWGAAETSTSLSGPWAILALSASSARCLPLTASPTHGTKTIEQPNYPYHSRW